MWRASAMEAEAMGHLAPDLARIGAFWRVLARCVWRCWAVVQIYMLLSSLLQVPYLHYM
jgi:hypothetical protein